MKKKFIVIFGLVCLTILLFFVFKNECEKTQIMYRILEFNGDTTVWDPADCTIRDSSFSCSKEIIYNFPDIEKRLRTQKQKSDTALQQKVTYKNLNFGKNAIVNYIPIADIPAFDRNNVAHFFSYISGSPCSKLLTFHSNYKIEAIGLPDYFKWDEDDRKKWMSISKDTTGQNVCESHSLRSPSRHPPLLRYIKSRHFLPEQEKNYEYQLLNTSILYKDTTFSWKLVYKDQYGRGDTLDITTKFEVNQNYTPTKCYDSAIERFSTKASLFYRILDFRGDTTIWHPSDCKIFGDRFSCVRRLSAPKGEQCNNPYHKENSSKATYKDLNFGKDAVTNYIPVANIPEFNRDSVAKVFSVLPSTSCSALLTFKSNYSIEPIGLPKDFEWRRDFPKAVVKEISKKKKLCTLEYQSASKRPVPYKQYRDIIFEELPEKASVYNYQLFNKSLQSYKDSTIKWKLVYKDQYGRGDTLDITTKFE